MTDQLRAAAQAIIDSWDGGHFFTTGHADRIGNLRAALAEPYADKAKQFSGTQLHIDPVTGNVGIGTVALAEPECCCGEPTASGVVHRQDGPCYMAEPVAYIYEVRFTDKPDREWCYCGLYRSKAQVKSILDRTTDGDIEGRIVPLYVSPPRREWVGLTDDDLELLERQYADYDIYRAIEAALKEKNHD